MFFQEILKFFDDPKSLSKHPTPLLLRSRFTGLQRYKSFYLYQILFLKNLKVFIDLYPSVDNISLIVSASLKALLRYRLTLVFQWGKDKTTLLYKANEQLLKK